MSRHSAKAAGRSAKTVRRTSKKASKSARTAVKKASKTARRPAGKARSTASTGLRAKAPARKELTAAPAASVAPVAPIAPIAPIASITPPARPIAPPPSSRGHKYQVGETVYYTSPTFGRTAASGIYTVVKLLPSESDDYQYRIKSNGETFERVAKESQLDKI